MKRFFIIAFIFASRVCIAQTCHDIPKSFSSYKIAIEAIKKADFTLVEHCDTSKSSWVRSASFYSCDSRVGYLILRTHNKAYVHKNVPYYLWKEFRNAKSFGGFYNSKIKGKYQLNI